MILGLIKQGINITSIAKDIPSEDNLTQDRKSEADFWIYIGIKAVRR